MATDAVLLENLQTMQTRIDLIFEQQKRDHEFLQAQLDTLKATIAKTAVAATATAASKEKGEKKGDEEVGRREVVSLGDVSSKIGRLPEDSVRAYLEELKRLRSEYDDLARYATSTLHHLQTPTTPTSTPTATVLAPLQEGIKDYWAKAEVDASSGMFVDVGLGLHLEMSFEEARDWAALVVGALEVRIEKVREVVDGRL